MPLVIPQLQTRAAPRCSADVGRMHLYPFALPLLFADDELTLGPLYFVGDNTFTIRFGASGGGATAVDVFLILLEPFTLQPILDPFAGRFYDSLVSVNQNATTFRFGANVVPPSNAFDVGSECGPFSLLFTTGIGNYSSTCWIDGYHLHGTVT